MVVSCRRSTCLVEVAVLLSAAACAEVLPFEDTWGSGHSVVGFEPPPSPGGSGGLPVYVWLAGSGFTWHNWTTDRDQLQRMASLGTVAGQCAYANWRYPLGGCSSFLDKARPIFDLSDPASCLARLCRRPSAYCSRGVAVHGFSQGAQLAALAQHFAPLVSAALLMGHGDNPTPFTDLSGCMDYVLPNGTRSPVHRLDRRQVRSLVGEHDGTFSCCFDRPDAQCCWRKKSGREQQIATTGYSCPAGQHNCLQADGSGWYVVSDAEAGKAEGANHCFAWSGGCLPQPHDAWNERYLGDCPWCLDGNLRWLYGAATSFASASGSGLITV